MRRKPGRTALAATSILCSLILAACNCAPTLRYVSVAPASATIFAAAIVGSGETPTTTIVPCTTQQFAATAYYSDGSQKDISSGAGWGSSNTSAATVDATGLASVASTVTTAGGTSVITATSSGASATANLAVNILTAITITPATATVPLGGTQQYTATGTFNTPGSTATTTMDLTTQVAWSVTGGTTSSDGTTNSNSIATIGTATGLLTSDGEGQDRGTTNVIATLCTMSASTAVTIGPPSAQILKITPVAPSIAVGQTVDFIATIINTDGSISPVTGPVTWSSDNTSFASIISNPVSPWDGLATGIAAGTANIGASYGTDPNIITGATTLTVSPAVARFAYVANSGDSSISEYAVNYSSGSTPAPNGTLTPLGKFSVPNGVRQVVVHPSGNYVYAIGTDGTSTITQFTVDPTTGALTNTTNTTPAALSSQVSYAMLDPTGSYLYVANHGDNSIVVFSVAQSSGQLSSTPIQTKTVNVSGPIQLFYSVAGPYLYSVNVGNHTVSGYTVSTSGSTVGQITEITAAGGVFDLAANDSSYAFATFGAIDPSGTYIYVPDGATNVEGIGVGTGGILSVLTGSPFAVAGSSLTANASVDPTTKYLYVADITNSKIFTLPLSSGVPGAVTGSPASVGANPVGIAEDTSGAILLVANNQGNTLSSFAVASGGVLPTSGSAIATATSPQFPVFYNGTAAASIAPAEVVAANPGSSNVAAFTSGSDGVLTADPETANYPTFPGNNFVATSSLSDLIVTGGTLTNQVATFIATPANAGTSPTLTATPGSPATIATASARPTAIVVD